MLMPCERALRRRREETFQAAQEIHGGTSQDQTPGELGLMETVIKNCSDRVVVQELGKRMS